MHDAFIPWLVLLFLAYLCGSIPFALLVGKAHGVDVRQVGSGNVGATNLGRTIGRKWGVLCFVLDALKGVLPVLIAGWWMGMFDAFTASAPQGPDDAGVAEASPHMWFAWAWLGVAALAMMGHIFPVWLRFRGGKGVATGFGAMLGFWPILTLPTLGAVVVWLVTAGVSRYVGLASVLAALSLPITLAVGGPMAGLTWSVLTPFLIVSTLLALLVAWRHRGNLARTFAGTEPRIGQRPGAADADSGADAGASTNTGA